MDLASEKETLIQRDARWATLAAEGRDVEAILSYWTDDAMVLPPGLKSVRGKEALREYVRSSLSIPGFSITWKSSDVVMSPDGMLAYMFSANSMTMAASDGNKVTLPGRAITIWRKEPDGEWRCAVDIWNEPPA
jgi:ketosteroid isomerase-like protein